MRKSYRRCSTVNDLIKNLALILTDIILEHFWLALPLDADQVDGNSREYTDQSHTSVVRRGVQRHDQEEGNHTQERYGYHQVELKNATQTVVFNLNFMSSYRSTFLTYQYI